MFSERVLLESRTACSGVHARVEALDKVKALRLLPDGVHVTTRMVAAYFEVGERAISTLIMRHREELSEHGYRVLQGSELQSFLSFNLKLRKIPGRGLAVFPRSAVLNAAMLLRESEVARQVRAYLLEAELRSRTAPGSDALHRRLDTLSDQVRAHDQALRENGALLLHLDRLTRANCRVECAMSSRLAELRMEMDAVLRTLDALSAAWPRRRPPTL